MGLMSSARFVRAWEDRQLRLLVEHYGAGWDIWLAREFPGVTYWRANFKGSGDGPGTLTAESPEELVTMIARPAGNYNWSPRRRRHA